MKIKTLRQTSMIKLLTNSSHRRRHLVIAPTGFEHNI